MIQLNCKVLVKNKKKLFTAINELVNNKEQFVKNPNADFTRNRKLNLNNLIKFILVSGSDSIRKELYKYFKFSVNTATASAFIQQRSKLLPSAFEFLFKSFTSQIKQPETYRGYKLLACDGSAIRLMTDATDTDTYWCRSGECSYNALRLNALYDLLNKVYIDAVVQNEPENDERKAFFQMVDRLPANSKTIIMADRGYESYNCFEHVRAKKCFYLIRVKDISSNGISSGYNLLDEEFDIRISKVFTNKQTNKIKSNSHYKLIPSNVRFDFLSKNNNYYLSSFRIVRFKISSGYECIITNLNEQEFSAADIKELYNLRWGIETSFRELKYDEGLSNLHSKNRECVLQEIFARLTLFNFCSTVIESVAIKENSSKYRHQINRTTAIFLCKYYLNPGCKSPPDIENLIARNTLPVRPGRQDKRKLKPKSFVSFNYRVN